MDQQPANNQGQSTLQPLPPSQKQHVTQHHPSITSLNRNSLTNRRNQSPAPPAALPAELQTTPESVQLQDSWVLGSNVPLESSMACGPLRFQKLRQLSALSLTHTGVQ
ncbi:hypothetical protein J1605_019270 [Eschrichtius robustus]|uniref:Teneurin N-terminal domain-containing protein n=1 Tax=Eschrichtius robustus TaxID=9764 RepID=A0AB34HLB7_ESCRO|nr:hypothetical protein J1605_019270 [Eschrichtius robustus]